MRKFYVFRFFIFLFLLSFLSPVISPAASPETSPWKKFSLDAGLFVPLFNTGIRLDSNSLGRGTDIDGEDDLNLDTDLTVFRAEAQWRFFPRHRLEFTYYDISRDSTGALLRTLQFGDRPFTIGANISTGLEIQIFKIAYTWSFIQTQKYEMGISLGIDLMDLEASISAPIIGKESESVTAPLPVIGLRTAYAITPEWILNSYVDFFYIDIDDLRGRLIDLNINLEYYFWKHLSLAMGYNFFDVDVDYASDTRVLDVGYLFHGPKATLKLYF